VYLQNGIERCLEIAFHGLYQVKHISIVRPSLYVDDSVSVKVPHEFGRVYCGRHDYQFERSLLVHRDQLESFVQNGHEDIGIDASLVGFIQDEEVVGK
jgi:hypothetical protein